MTKDQKPKHPLVVLSPDDSTTLALGAAFAQAWTAGGEEFAVVSLAGPLGAGKTHFAKGVVAGLGGDAQEVTSPTFTLLDIHDTKAAEVHHVDCYRLHDAADAFDVGLEATLAPPEPGQRRKLVLIEWAERLPGLLPAQSVGVRDIALAHVTPTMRRLTARGLTDAERSALRRVCGDPR